MTIYLKYFFLILITLQIVFPVPSQAQNQQINETAAKAAFVYNAALYFSWPPPHGEYIIIGILGKGPLEREWKSIDGKKQNSRTIKIIKTDDVEELQECQIVYIEEISPKKITRILSRLHGYPIVTIGDSPAFISSGGTLNLYLANNRISFSANLAEARSVGIDISSKLLKLATEVIR